ncbi:hypothetical protein SAMN05444159_3972 [Bradyrhizobium lablabi]|uniref:Uncharacterized protein n=1 Tax=Bradyrhizobium lablabi TaxID=722472 RepID=A0A1M6UN74_9BRAD|nr:hypothetical protein [Bradyrhizobium lablabi]SHK70652.1 hypothetical protein SAMN05444159_3972 [Bradyrhizobium lablabi]
MPDAANMIRRNVVIAIALIFGSAATTAMAQFPLPGSTEQPAPLVREAFASPYGRALIAELGTVLRTDADPVCLNSKGIAFDQLQPRGEALLIKWGTRATETVMSLVDLKTYEKNFPAGAELNGLRERPEIKRYLDIERPLRLAKILDFIFEQFDRYNLLNRIKIAPVSPAASGKDDLLRTNPTESAEEAPEDFIATHQSAQLKRYLALSEQAAAAMVGAVSKEQAIRIVPGTFYRGIELDLAELCIVPRR